MKTSVIVTTYNRPNALIKVLKGLNCQTCLPDEVIIADDGSSDDTAEKINDLKTHTPYRLKHVWHKDNGFRAAKIRNKAVKICSGEYIIFIDGDCVPDKHFVADHIKLSRKGFFFQGKRVLIEKKHYGSFSHKDINTRFKKLMLFVSQKPGNWHHIMRIVYFPSIESKRLSGVRSCNMGIFKKDLYAVNGFNENFAGWGREDSELVVRLYKFGLKRKTHPFLAICYHLWHKENDRSNLEKNDMLLKQAMESKNFVCDKGLVENTNEKFQ